MGSAAQPLCRPQSPFSKRHSEALDLALAVLMMYVATLAPTIAFGGLLQEQTGTGIPY